MRSLLLAFTLALVSGCPSSHDPSADGGGGGVDAPSSGTDAPSSGTDAPSTGTDAPAPGTDAPVTGTDAPFPLACDVPSACTLRPASCCGSCGAATPDDMIALPDDEVAAYVAVVCEDVGCPECASPTDPYLLATCQAGSCVAVNLHTSPLTECTLDSDCVFSPRECCACGLLTVNDVVSHNPANGSFGSLVCDPDADCPPCVPTGPADVEPSCDLGRCGWRSLTL